MSTIFAVPIIGHPSICMRRTSIHKRANTPGKTMSSSRSKASTGRVIPTTTAAVNAPPIPRIRIRECV